MVLHNHLEEADTIFSTILGLLVNNTLIKWIGVIRRGSYQAADEDIRWAYEPVSDLWPDIEPYSDSSVGGSGYKGSKYQDKLDDREQ